MNDWYIDRSKNVINDNFDSMIEFFMTLKDDSNSANANYINQKLKDKHILGGAEGNPAAALTRLRDHGLINTDNKLGDSAVDYYNGFLDKPELIIDLLYKRPALKSNSPNVKPFIILCTIFDIMFQMNLDEDDIFLMYEECKEYLYSVDSYEEITFELVEKIIEGRTYSYSSKLPNPRVTLNSNEDTNLSIWFNALKLTPVFMPNESVRKILKPNYKQKEFFRFISANANEVSCTPTSNNKELYNYYCDRNKGINEILPDVVKSKTGVPSIEEVQQLFEFLFGYKKVADFDYSKYLKYDCFGLFFPYITLPKLVIRKIYMCNENIGNALYEFVKINHGYLEAIYQNQFEFHENEENDSKLPQYDYSTSTITDGQNLIVYGTPGCGKSHYVEHTLLKDYPKENYIRTTFFQDYTNTDFVGQILPKVEGEKVTYEFNPGPFTLALELAIKKPNERIALVIEELNRGSAASIFGDVFQLLDRKEGASEYAISNVNIINYLKEQFKGVYTFDSIKLPGNLSIFATMNSSDQNVFTLDTAFKRRWKFKKLLNKFESDHLFKDKYIPGADITWQNFVNGINKFILESSDGLNSEDKQLGVYFVDEKGMRKETLDVSDTNAIEEFAYKVLEYLWDDVAKFGRPNWFDKEIKSLDQLVEKYKEQGIGVFSDGVFKK